jgi:hypothetical protein
MLDVFGQNARQAALSHHGRLYAPCFNVKRKRAALLGRTLESDGTSLQFSKSPRDEETESGAAIVDVCAR